MLYVFGDPLYRRLWALISIVFQVQNTLSIVENLLDFRPESSNLCVKQGLYKCLLTRATTRKRVFDSNKLYASQLLHMLLQSTEQARKELVSEKLDGVDLLLRALAVYKRHDPASPDEFEVRHTMCFNFVETNSPTSNSFSTWKISSTVSALHFFTFRIDKCSSMEKASSL